MIEVLIALAAVTTNPYPDIAVCLGPDDVIVAQGPSFAAVRPACVEASAANPPIPYRLVSEEVLVAPVPPLPPSEPPTPTPTGPIPADLLAVLNSATGRVDITLEVTRDRSDEQVSHNLIRFDTRLAVYTWRDAVHVRFRDLNTGVYQILRSPWGVLPVGTHVITVTWDPEGGYALIVDGRLMVHVFELFPLSTAFIAGGSDAVGSGDAQADPFSYTAESTLAPYDPCTVNVFGTLNRTISDQPDPRGRAPGCSEAPSPPPPPEPDPEPVEPTAAAVNTSAECGPDTLYFHWDQFGPEPPTSGVFRLFIGTTPNPAAWDYRWTANASFAGFCVAGLQPQTEYTAFMRSQLGTTLSPFSNPLTFTTD